MKACSKDFFLVTLFSVSLLLLLRREAASTPSRATVYNAVRDDAVICHDGFMSVYLSKEQFADLPFTIYVQDGHSGYYQAAAVAKRCHYFFAETDTFIVFTVSSQGCFVRRRENTTNLNLVIMALVERGGVEIVKLMRLICDRETEEVTKNVYPLVSRHFSCSKDGFNITIPRNASVPPLNLDAVWIPSSQNQCKPKTRSRDAVTFSFRLTDCGTRSMVADGIITYWVNIELKQHPQRGSIFRDTPFNLTMHCSFALAQMTHLDIEVHGEKSPSTLKSEGLLRTEMRFAKDSSYTSFYSSHEPPTVTELGQPVYVEVFVLKHEDNDLALLLEDCWATPTENPNDTQRWNLLVKGCPFSGDSHRSAVLPVVYRKELKYPSLHKWFMVRMFSFVKPQTLENLVYFHCDVEICKGPDCSRSCSNGRQKIKRITPGSRQRIFNSLVSGGPLLYHL